MTTRERKMIKLNEYLAKRIEETRKEKKIKVVNLCKKSQISFVVYRHICLALKNCVVLATQQRQGSPSGSKASPTTRQATKKEQNLLFF